MNYEIIRLYNDVTETMLEGFDNIFEEMDVWIINLCFGEKHSLLVMDLLKVLVNRIVELCDMYEYLIGV